MSKKLEKLPRGLSAVRAGSSEELTISAGCIVVIWNGSSTRLESLGWRTRYGQNTVPAPLFIDPQKSKDFSWASKFFSLEGRIEAFFAYHYGTFEEEKGVLSVHFRIDPETGNHFWIDMTKDLKVTCEDLEKIQPKYLSAGTVLEVDSIGFGCRATMNESQDALLDIQFGSEF